MPGRISADAAVGVLTMALESQPQPHEESTSAVEAQQPPPISIDRFRHCSDQIAAVGGFLTFPEVASALSVSKSFQARLPVGQFASFRSADVVRLWMIAPPSTHLANHDVDRLADLIFRIAANEPIPSPLDQRTLLHYIAQGKTHAVSAGLRQFLALPATLVTDAQKAEWILSVRPGGRPPLERICGSPTGKLEALERAQYASVAACVEAILRSDLPPEIRSILLRNATGKSLVDLAVSASNPAAAVHVLLGIARAGHARNGGAAPEVPGNAANSLQNYHRRAPDWVDGVLQELKAWGDKSGN